MDTIRQIVNRLPDKRSGRVIFLSHCILNENTRYLGGACRGGCVREVVEQCIEREVGIVQMPCPEQQVWGGVLKKHMLRLYGLCRPRGPAAFVARVLAPVLILYSRLRFRLLARRTVKMVADYVESGYRVEAIVGIDGSPTCGVHTKIGIQGFLAEMLSQDAAHFNTARQNEMVRRYAVSGSGLFTLELRRALERRGLNVPFVAHDLLGELRGVRKRLRLPAGIEGRRPSSDQEPSRPAR